MKKITFILVLNLIFTNPFKELDKSFLYESNEKSVSNQQKIVHNNDECIAKLSSETIQPPILLEYFKDNPSDINDFCKCIPIDMSLKDFVEIKNSFNQLLTSKQKIDDKFFNLIENQGDCFINLIRKWNEKEILNYILASLSENPKQETLKDDGKDKPKPKKKVD